MKKLMGLLVLGFGLVLLGNLDAHAAASVRGAKASTNVGQSTNPIGISSTTAVLYSVVVGTGAVTDYVTVFDSNAVTGLTSSQLSGNFKMRVYASSTTQNTVVVFDPPIQFKNGIIAIPSSAVENYLFTWESGHVTQGY